ncbi:MAG TPA: selenocysteine-specific translation elongation factor [Acidisarcina sp.]
MRPAIKSVVIGTAGHIDHGKTALIRALTGTDTDRLPEEKRRGMTIDLGFAFLDASATDGTRVRIGFVDVPGHGLFIRNMLSGTGSVGAVLLVISAQEGIKPQTVEHLAICNLLSVARGIAVITKIDAVSATRLQEVRLEVEHFLRGTFLSDERRPILPVSAKTGEGIEELRRGIVALAVDLNLTYPDHLARLPIDRAFVVKGFGTVVTGTLISGTLLAGQSLVLEPGGRPVRLRGMQTNGQAEEEVIAGSRVAANLADVEVSEVSRGQTLVAADTLSAVSVIDAEVTLLDSAAPLKHRARVYFHALTSSTLASVSIYDNAAADPATTALMRLTLQSPVVLIPGDHFVLRQASPPATIGGGRVLDAYPSQNLRKANVAAWLRSLQVASAKEQIDLRIERRGTQGLPTTRLMAETGLTRDGLLRISGLTSSERLLLLPGNLFLAQQAAEEASAILTARLKQEKSGSLSRSELKGQSALGAEVFDYVLVQLVRSGKVALHGDLVFLSGSGAIAPDADTALLSTIASLYKVAGLAAPLTSEVAARLDIKETDMRRLTTALLREKVLVRMGSETLLVHRDALNDLRISLVEMRGHSFDIATFKQRTGLSRKYAIPLLEYLDRERITRKTGDKRLVL